MLMDLLKSLTIIILTASKETVTVFADDPGPGQNEAFLGDIFPKRGVKFLYRVLLKIRGCRDKSDKR
jgi:hypothetical protein